MQKSAGDHRGHRADGFSWLDRRDYGLSRGPAVRPRRFFPSASGTSGSTNDGAVNTPELLVDLDFALQLLKDRIERNVAVNDALTVIHTGGFPLILMLVLIAAAPL
jgi:hypothetical protein